MAGVEGARSVDMEEFGRMFGLNELATLHDSGYTFEEILVAAASVEDVQDSARERLSQVNIA